MININNKRVVGVAKGNTNFSKIYKGTDLVFQKESGDPSGLYPNNEIHYTTSTNYPTSNVGWSDDEILSNEYDAELGHCVLKLKDVIREIPNSFFYMNSLVTSVIYLPPTITKIGDRFCYMTNNLTSIDLSTMYNVKTIGNYFLSSTGLTTLDLSSFRKIEEDRVSYCLIRNSRLKNIYINMHRIFPFDNLSELYNLDTLIWVPCDMVYKYIEKFPMFDLSIRGIGGCPDLGERPEGPYQPGSYAYSDNEIHYKAYEAIDVSKLDWASVNNSIIRNSYDFSLGHYVIRFSTNLTAIPDDFFRNASDLIAIYYVPKTVKHIGNYFCSSCSNVQYIDMGRMLNNLESIGNDFCEVCTKLWHIELPFFADNATVGNAFLERCRSLEKVDLTFYNVISIGYGLLLECDGLKSIDTYPLYNITEIKDNWFASCRNLTEIDLTPMENLQSVAHGAFATTNLKTLIMPQNRVIDLTGMNDHIGENGFTYEDLQIRVPSSFIDEYRNTYSALSKYFVPIE